MLPKLTARQAQNPTVEFGMGCKDGCGGDDVTGLGRIMEEMEGLLSLFFGYGCYALCCGCDGCHDECCDCCE
eukprot:scaffold98149_cov24-Cyclotella_meneghiniana.AAC.1